MGEKPQNSADSRTRFWLIAGMMVISTVLFIIGGMMERNPSEAGEAPGVHEEAGERAHQEPASNERVLGFNLENPWAITVVASVWFVLAAGLFRWGQRLLVPVAILAAATAFVDVREVLLQLGQSRTSIALLAGIVTVAHVAVAIFALVTWGAFRRSSA